MALDEEDLKKLQTLFGLQLKPLQDEIGALKAARPATPAPIESSTPAKDGGKESAKESPKDANTNGGADSNQRLQQLEREVRHAAVLRTLPPSVNRERAPQLLRVLEAEGRLLTRDGQHVLRVERNGALVDMPLEAGFTEWAGTKEADPWISAPPTGSGATPSNTTSRGGTGAAKVTLDQVGGRIMQELLKQ